MHAAVEPQAIELPPDLNPNALYTPLVGKDLVPPPPQSKRAAATPFVPTAFVVPDEEIAFRVSGRAT